MFHQPLNSRGRRQPLPFLFAMVLGDSLLVGSIGGAVPIGCGSESVERVAAL
jgi:hypothetical protein